MGRPEKMCCVLLQRAIDNDRFPIRYDDYVQEVQLELKEGHAVVRHCPFCGEKQHSGRDRLFTKPSEEEKEEASGLLHCLSSLADVIAQFGEPDFSGTGCGRTDRPWKKWIRYSRRWSSLDLTVGEYQEGGISWVIGGYYIGRKDSAD